MRTITEKFNVYKFDEASPELKDKIRNSFDSDGFHYEHCMRERIQTLEALAELLKGRLDYSLSCVPDRGEFITIKPKYDELDFQALRKIVNEDCPLTGVCYDYDILEVFKEFSDRSEMENLREAFRKYIESIHREYQDMLSDEYLLDHCEANGYEFTEDGKIHH